MSTIKYSALPTYQLVLMTATEVHSIDWDYNQPWYHGTPLRLATIYKGSTVTQDRNLARIFSHKPTLVSISDEGLIKHNGAMPGYLYRIDDVIRPNDVYPHPNSSMEWGKEWLTNRELRVRLIDRTEFVGSERLTENEVIELMKKRAHH